MKKLRTISALIMLLTVLFIVAVPVLADGEAQPAAVAEEQTQESSGGSKALGAGIAIAISAGLGALGMGLATGHAAEAMARQPEIKGDIRTNLILGIVFMETAIIYALIVAVLIIFVM